MAALSKSERLILQRIDGQPDKIASHHACRSAAKLTHRGFVTVMARMIDRRLIAVRSGEGYTLTFGGLRALGTA